MNGSDYSHRQQGQQPYLNQVTVNKHHTPQHTVPVQSAYLVGSAMGRNGLSPSSTASIYHFAQQNSQQVGGSLVIDANLCLSSCFDRSLDSRTFYRRWRRTFETSSSTSRCDCYNLSLKRSAFSEPSTCNSIRVHHQRARTSSNDVDV